MSSQTGKHKTVKRIARVFFLLLVLFLGVILFIRSPWGQDIIVNKLIDYVSDKTETKVTIDKLFLTFSGDIQLEGLYLEDKKEDTLLYSRSLEADIEFSPLLFGNTLELDIEIETGSVYNNYYLEEYNLVIDYTVENDWFDLKAFVLVGDEKIPFIKLRKHILEDKREYLLPDGKVLIIPEDWFAKYKSLFELGMVSDELLKVHKQHFSLLNDAFNTDECTSCQGLEKLVIPEIIPEVKPPEGLKITLRKYQEEGLNWLLFLQKNNLGGCLADDMGLGKTIQTLALLQYNKESSSGSGMEPVKVKKQATLFNNTGTQGTTLLIVPSSLVHNWSNEIIFFSIIPNSPLSNLAFMSA